MVPPVILNEPPLSIIVFDVPVILPPFKLKVPPVSININLPLST